MLFDGALEVGADAGEEEEIAEGDGGVEERGWVAGFEFCAEAVVFLGGCRGLGEGGGFGDGGYGAGDGGALGGGFEEGAWVELLVCLISVTSFGVALRWLGGTQIFFGNNKESERRRQKQIPKE